MTSLKAVEQRAKIIAKNNNDLNQCIDKNVLPNNIDVSLSEGIILGLLKQNVRKYFAIFGHGSTDFAEILRIYCLLPWDAIPGHRVIQRSGPSDLP